MKKYVQTITIKAHHSDKNQKATVCALFNHMLDAAWEHAQIMDWGYDILRGKNMFWVLSRIRIEVDQYPTWQEELTLNTWSAGTDGIYAYREFIIVNKQGETLLRANSAWLILDLSTKKIVMLRDHISTFPVYTKESPCRKPQKIKPTQHPAQLSFSPILYSELDINNHFNSVKALERALDSFGIEFLDSHEADSIEINYLKEGIPGNMLALISRQIEDNGYQLTFVRDSDSADIITLKIRWKRKCDNDTPFMP